MLSQKHIQAYIQKWGPYLYHTTERDAPIEGELSLAQSIEKWGLQGNDAYHPIASVYLSPKPDFESSTHEKLGTAIFRVKIQDLDPALLEADEWQLMGKHELFDNYQGEAAELDKKQLEFLKQENAAWMTLTGTKFGAIAYRGSIAPEFIERVDMMEIDEFDTPLVIGENQPNHNIEL